MIRFDLTDEWPEKIKKSTPEITVQPLTLKFKKKKKYQSTVFNFLTQCNKEKVVFYRISWTLDVHKPNELILRPYWKNKATLWYETENLSFPRVNQLCNRTTRARSAKIRTRLDDDRLPKSLVASARTWPWPWSTTAVARWRPWVARRVANPFLLFFKNCPLI